MGRRCLACVRRRQTVCLGTHTICSSLVSTSFFPLLKLSFLFFCCCFFFFSFKLNQISLGVGSGWREDLPSLAFIIWLQIVSIHFLFHAGPLPIFFFFSWPDSRQRHLRNPSAVGAWQWRTERLDSHRWSYMDVFGWTILKVARNVSQLVFSIHIKRKTGCNSKLDFQRLL